MGFRSTVLAGVLSTLIAAFITWLLGFWPTVWAWVGNASSAIWAVAAYVIPVPTGVLVLLGVVLTYLCARKPSGAKAAVSTPSRPLEQTARDLPQLSENELAVIRLLAAADGRWAGIEEIASVAQLSRLLTEQALEKLFAKGFLRDRHNYLDGTSFRLSSAGRDYAIEQGFVR